MEFFSGKDQPLKPEPKQVVGCEKQCTRLKMSASLRIPLDEISQFLFSFQLRTKMQSWLSLSGIRIY